MCGRGAADWLTPAKEGMKRYEEKAGEEGEGVVIGNPAEIRLRQLYYNHMFF